MRRRSAHGERDVARVARRVRDPLFAGDSREVAVDLRRVDLAVAVARIDPRDEPAVPRPRHRDAAHVALGARRELHLLVAPAGAVEMGDVHLAVVLVARGDPGDGDAVLRRTAGRQGDAADRDARAT